MEVFNPDYLNANWYRSTIIQSGRGSIDRYIYSQNGEGIASFFGNLFRTVAPILGQAIKGTARLAKPHIQRLGSDIIRTGSKRAIEAISDDISKKISTPRKVRTPRKRQKTALSILKAKHNHNIARK